MARRLLSASAMLVPAAALTVGCAHAPSGPSSAVIVNKIQTNPNMTPAMRQSMLQTMQNRQAAGRIRGQLMHRTQTGQ